MSTAYHPMTDGQTENANRTIEQIIRNYISYSQDNWDEILMFAEFSFNNTTQCSTGFSPFQLLYSENPLTCVDFPTNSTKVPAVEEMMNQMKILTDLAADNITEAQDNQKKHADKKRRDHDFKI
jgi:hypothetical protein